MFSNYSWVELRFGRYKIIRKISKSFWVKIDEEGYCWVKMKKDFFYSMRFRPEAKFLIEDYTK